MRKLYLKIVVAIWVVMIATAASAILLVGNFVPDDPRAEKMFRRSFDHMAEVVAAAAVSRNHGADEQDLIRWFDNDPMARRLSGLLLLDDAGVELLRRGNGGAGGLEKLRSRADFEYDGRSYTLYAVPPARGGFSHPQEVRRTVAALIRHPGYRWLVLLIAVLISILLSVLLARYLVRPLAAIDTAGRKLASGDLSVRVAAELGNRGDEIADFATTFDHMAGRIEALVTSHKELLRDVSHELRSPLARAHAALSLARQQTDGAVDGELDRIEHEIERLDAMIGKLLAYSRLDANQFQLHLTAIDLVDFLQDLIGDAQFEADLDSKSLLFCDSDRVDVLADTELLASAFENILRNAIRHTPVFDRVDISVKQSESSQGQCVVTVRDHGNGVNEDELEKIFHPFFKSVHAAATNDSGSGIGLAIARQAIALHGGTVVAENATSGGLAIIVTLPSSESVI